MSVAVGLFFFRTASSAGTLAANIFVPIGLRFLEPTYISGQTRKSIEENFKLFTKAVNKSIQKNAHESKIKELIQKYSNPELLLKNLAEDATNRSNKFAEQMQDPAAREAFLNKQKENAIKVGNKAKAFAQSDQAKAAASAIKSGASSAATSVKAGINAANSKPLNKLKQAGGGSKKSKKNNKNNKNNKKINKKKTFKKTRK